MNPYLVLVNKTHPVPTDYLSHVELVSARGAIDPEVWVEHQTLEAFKALASYVKETENLVIGMENAYRSVEAQQQIYEEFCVSYGKDYADAIVAPVGKSEHHLGICIDLMIFFEGEGFISTNENFERTRLVFEEHVHPHLHKFGFILRYPAGKEEITGYPYEPWHIRYVGCDAAREITQEGVTLEQWLGD